MRFMWVARLPKEDDEMRRAMGETGGKSRPSCRKVSWRGLGKGDTWLSRVDILNHPAVGGFVTHCGWNSVLEATCARVPMLAWPLYAEQKLNRAYLVEKMEVAMEINMETDGFVKAEELEERVKELMHSETGKTIRERVHAMKEEAAMASCKERGSSVAALAESVESIGQVHHKDDMPNH